MVPNGRFRRTLRAALLLLAGAAALSAQIRGKEQATWNEPFAPFQIIGNVYYVGASGVSSFLVTSPAGHILVDGGFRETAPQIERNVAALGFRMKDVQYLLGTHAHYDHAGGLAELKHASGAKMVASEADAPTLESGYQRAYGKGQDDVHFPRVAVDRRIHDGETISLGGTTVTAHLTPGHTKGCTSWSLGVEEKAKSYHVVIDCSTTVAGNQLVNNTKYPGIVADYERSFAVLRKLPADVFLGPHPSFFHMREKLAQRRTGGPNPFVDPGELRRFVEESERDFRVELDRQRKENAGW